MSLDRFVRASNAAACDTLGQLGPSLVNVGVWTMWTPKIGITALTLGAASNLAYQYGCGDLDVGEATDDGTSKGCQQLASGYADLAVYDSGGNFKTYLKKDITGYTQSAPFPSGGNSLQTYTFQEQIGGAYGGSQNIGLAPGDYTELILQDGASCEKDVEPRPELPAPTTPFNYTDPETNCELTLNFQGFAQISQGTTPQPVYLIQSPQTLRAGGRIGGCQISPTIYYGGPNGDGGGGNGGGGGTSLPLPPGPIPPFGPEGEPWWVDLIKGALGGIAAGVAEQVLETLFASVYPGLIYRMVSVCEKDASGEPISEAIEVPIPPLTAPAAQLARLDAIVELLQASKNFKQPICAPEKPQLQGDWRTISFRSDSTSPYGKSRLCKRFRYRSTSGLGLGEVVDYWKDFTFQSGPVIVIHSGSTWGTPQVWAATADEGKRVIRHAAGEAGIDPDQVGRWTISGSDSARYGVSDTMRVDTTGGYYWITSRDGSNGKPVVAL